MLKWVAVSACVGLEGGAPNIFHERVIMHFDPGESSRHSRPLSWFVELCS